MRVPIERYLQGAGTKVHSYVVAVPFSPIDLDLGHLTRGEWDALTDRFRIWYMPGDAGSPGQQLCYVVIRKFDSEAGVLTYVHIIVNLSAGLDDAPDFMVGVLSNDDVRSRTALNAIVGVPPVFHRRSELRVVEHRWRTDPSAVLRFTANVHSVCVKPSQGEAGFNLKFKLQPGVTDELRRNMGAWWPNFCAERDPSVAHARR